MDQKNMKLESETDVNPFNFLSKNSRFGKESVEKSLEETKTKVKFDPESMFYDMTGDKHLVIFNHNEYDKESVSYYRKPPLKRTGTDQDVKALEKTFEKLGFTFKTYHDKDRETIWNVLKELREKDFSSSSCLCIVILTHGAKKGELYAYDAPYFLQDVTKLFESHPTLVGKPKLFFIQACRGGYVDDGNRIAIDGPEENFFVTPSHADFLIVRSTVEDYMSYRDCRGSWLIQELCKAIQEHSHEWDILHLLTLVQQKVAHGYTTYTIKKATNDKRQMPETTFTLTKRLKFLFD